jgi:hypothetical protein
MLTRLCIEAGLRQPQPLDGLSADDVRFDDFINIGFGDVAVPDRVGINHNIRSVLALIQTARLIGSHTPLQSAFGQLLFEKFLQFGLGEDRSIPGDGPPDADYRKQRCVSRTWAYDSAGFIGRASGYSLFCQNSGAFNLSVPDPLKIDKVPLHVDSRNGF